MSLRRQEKFKIAATALAAFTLCAGWAAGSPASSAGVDQMRDPAVLLQQVDNALQTGNVEQAITYANQALRLDPKSEEAHNKLGLCYAHQGQFDKAEDEFRAALECNPAYLPSLHNLGSMFYRNNDFDLAISYFKKELKTEIEAWHRGTADTLLSLADAYRDRAHARTDSHESAADYEQSTTYYKQALESDPRSAAAHNHFGVYYFQRGDLQSAEKQTQEAVALQKDYASAYYNLALIEEQRRKFPAAADAFAKSLQYETQPQYKQQVVERLKQLEGLMHKTPAPSEASSSAKSTGDGVADTLAKAHEAIQKADAAIKASGSEPHTDVAVKPPGGMLAIAEQPVDVSAARSPSRNDYLGESQQLLTRGNWAGAEELLRKAVGGRGSGDAVAWNNLGYALAMQARLHDAIDCYHKAIALLPDGFSSANYNLGQALLKSGDLDGAEHSFKSAIEQSGGMNPLSHNALGLVYKQKNQLQLACSEYKLAILQSSDSLPVVHYNLGVALESLLVGADADSDAGKQAIEHYERYLQQSPKGLNAQSAKARLAVLKGG